MQNGSLTTFHVILRCLRIRSRSSKTRSKPWTVGEATSTSGRAGGFSFKGGKEDWVSLISSGLGMRRLTLTTLSASAWGAPLRLKEGWEHGSARPSGRRRQQQRSNSAHRGIASPRGAAETKARAVARHSRGGGSAERAEWGPGRRGAAEGGGGGSVQRPLRDPVPAGPQLCTLTTRSSVMAAAAAAGAENPGGGPAAASHYSQHLSNRLGDR